MARPTMWASAYQHLGTLEHESWIDASVLNFHLLAQWYAVQGRTHVRYVDFFAAMPSISSSGIHALPDHQEIQLFQQRHLFNFILESPADPIAFVVMHSSHFFVVVFDYALKTAFILGRRISGAGVRDTPTPVYDQRLDDWNRWNGPFYWDRIAALHGFDAVDHSQTIIEVLNWVQNGYDCGPIACFVMESLMNRGLNDHSVHIPPISCGHQLCL